MAAVKRIKQAMTEFPEQATIVRDSYGGCKFCWMMDMAWCFVRYGARPIDYVRFEFHKKSGRERNRYLTIYKYFNFSKKLKKKLKSPISGDKSNEYIKFQEFIKRDWIACTSQTSNQEIIDFINRHQVLIAKPNHGEQGHGIFLVKQKDKGTIEHLLIAKESADFVLEECLVNIDSIKEMNPTSLNTFRCFTFIDKHGNIHILEVILRVGAPGSHVDNWGSGGVAYYFDIETGICKGPGIDKKNIKYINHPNSNVQLVGWQIPCYQNLLEYLEKLVSVCPDARFVGWDIALTEKGFDLIEMNCPGGHDILQGFGTPWGEFIKKNW